MTCVNCSNAIENGMISAFKDKGLIQIDEKYQVSVILLMHKMKITFDQATVDELDIKPQIIADEVEDLGFGAELVAEHRSEEKNEV